MYDYYIYMKRLIKATLLTLVIVAAASEWAKAQTQHYRYDDNAAYMASAQEKSLLYRGRLAPEYRFQYNGHCYAASRDFKKGEVLYNGRLYTDVLLNIDAYKQLLVVKANLISATDPQYVEYAFIDGVKYVNLSFEGRIKDAPKGFCSSEFEGDVSFYALVVKTLTSDDAYHNGADIGYTDPNYKEYVKVAGHDTRLNTYFAYSVKYYLVIDGRAVQVKTRAALLKLFDKPTAKAMRKYASKNQLNDAGVSFVDYAKRVLAYREQNLMNQGGAL